MGRGYDTIPLARLLGEVVEWFKAAVLKTVEVRASVGSNPTLSVYIRIYRSLAYAGGFFCCVQSHVSGV
jgi:hypothetical protein